MALSKSQIADELAAQDLGGKRQIINILNGLTDLAVQEIEAGEDFVVPGIAKISYAYRAKRPKGDKYKKGDTYVGFGGIETVAEADSKPVTEQVRLKATPTGAVAKMKPGSRPEAQKDFLKTTTGKAVRRRKAGKA